MNKILIIVVIIAICIGGVLYLRSHKGLALQKAVQYSDGILRFAQLDEKTAQRYGVIQDIANTMLVQDGVTRRYLVLLQNNLELRPGGGFLGQYATFSMTNGEVADFVVEDANILDKRYTSDRAAPQELQQYAGIKKWKFRDANLSPDFPTNVDNATHFYGLSGDNPEFDGVFALNASVLEDLLALTGPLTIAYTKNDDVTLEPGSALITLEDVVEERFIRAQERRDCEDGIEKNGIAPEAYYEQKENGQRVRNEDALEEAFEACAYDNSGERKKKVTHADKQNRKQVLQNLADAIIQHLAKPSQISDVITVVSNNLAGKDIQLWFADAQLQTLARDATWSGEVDQTWEGDYLMISDANIGALKTDYYMERALEYTVDFSGTGDSAEVNDADAGRMVRYVTPEVRSQIFNGSFVPQSSQARALPFSTVRMTYKNTGTEANYRTSDYHSYTRLYVPQGVTWYVREWFEPPTIVLEEFGKQVFNYKFDVLLGDTIPTMLQYTLPESITEEGYRLKVQKQSGIGTIPLTVKVIGTDGTEHSKSVDFEKDMVFTLTEEGLVAQ